MSQAPQNNSASANSQQESKKQGQATEKVQKEINKVEIQTQMAKDSAAATTQPAQQKTDQQPRKPTFTADKIMQGFLERPVREDTPPKRQVDGQN
jgi:hypothetical protein